MEDPAACAVQLAEVTVGFISQWWIFVEHVVDCKPQPRSVQCGVVFDRIGNRQVRCEEAVDPVEIAVHIIGIDQDIARDVRAHRITDQATAQRGEAEFGDVAVRDDS